MTTDRRRQAIPIELREAIAGKPRIVDGVTVCSHGDCERPNDSNGLCGTHYARWRTGKPLDAPMRGNQGPCSVEACDLPASALGLCKRHYGRQLAGRSLDAPFVKYGPICTVQGCDGKHATLGLCARHYGWQRKGKPLFRFPGVVERCSISGCTRSAKSATLCFAHYGKARQHHLSPIQLQWILALPSCEVCERPFAASGSGSRAIDHDHSCCSGAYTCGRCIRGIICSRCNVGIGMLGEDSSIFTSAMRYLGYTPSEPPD